MNWEKNCRGKQTKAITPLRFCGELEWFPIFIRENWGKEVRPDALTDEFCFLLSRAEKGRNEPEPSRWCFVSWADVEWCNVCNVCNVCVSYLVKEMNGVSTSQSLQTPPSISTLWTITTFGVLKFAPPMNDWSLLQVINWRFDQLINWSIHHFDLL